ncbi:MAG: DUF3549 family protein [Cocleimonas sp.]|nr:DUF3549 family protein [Cocleimonas sp.]
MTQNTTEKFDSITHFLQTGGFNYRVFDMGRKINRFSSEEFESIEGQKQAYPAPFQKKAWLALLFWESEKQNEATIWFLQFPIDELGFLKLEARDAFLIDLLEQTGKNIQAKQQGKQALDELKESPFAFKPNPDRLAMLHALATKALDQQPSQYYQHTRDYLSGSAGYEQWQFLGLQGIADVVARLGEEGNDDLLAKAIGLMPEEPLVSFCSALENIKPQGSLAQALVAKLENIISESMVAERSRSTPPHFYMMNDNTEPKAGANTQLISMLIRALSGAEPKALRQSMLQKILDSPLGKDIEIIAAISGRAWNDLSDKSVLKAFVTNLANQNQMAFDAILSDLMMIPDMRELLLSEVNGDNQTIGLSEKFDQFMRNVK